MPFVYFAKLHVASDTEVQLKLSEGYASVLHITSGTVLRTLHERVVATGNPPEELWQQHGDDYEKIAEAIQQDWTDSLLDQSLLDPDFSRKVRQITAKIGVEISEESRLRNHEFPHEIEGCKILLHTDHFEGAFWHDYIDKLVVTYYDPWA